MPIKDFAKENAGRILGYYNDINLIGKLIAYNEKDDNGDGNLWIDLGNVNGYKELNYWQKLYNNGIIKVVSVDDNVFVDGLPYYHYQTKKFNSAITLYSSKEEIEQLISALEL